ncbi:hypothetical protein LRP30_32445 [Bradyrhizobium sp. C-145]|nr:hypothetical protein [Bradyrhizobium sp. C-145]UQR61521.1 hypothetical protein LRP30_32445 [Bradyrhizobium sp. C-145]
MLGIIPAILRVLRTIRPKYGCRSRTEWRRPGEGVAAPDPRAA